MDKKESFLQYIRTEKRYSRNTVSSYKNDLDQFFRWLGVNAPDLTAGDVTQGEVRAWMVSLIEDGCATGTVHRKMSALRSFYRYLRKHGPGSPDPMAGLKLPKKSRLEKTVLSVS